MKYIHIIYKSNFKKSRHAGENDLNFSKLCPYILQRHCVVLVMVPPCFVILDIILAHDDLNFSSSVVVLM